MSIEMKVDALEDTFAKFIRHQNAALDLLVADKMATLSEDIDLVAHLASKNELMEVMDYGDTIAPKWTWDGTEYNPEMILCHDADAELEDGEKIHGAYFEWKYVTPIGLPFDEPEALYCFDGAEGAGDAYIEIGATNFGWHKGDGIQFTFSEAPAQGDQLVLNVNNNPSIDPTNNRTWTIYAKGSTTVKQTGTTYKGSNGTKLGTTSSMGSAYGNGNVNSVHRALYGYNRWSQSCIRQWLNSSAEAGSWWTPQNDWDRPPERAATVAGFLSGYSSDAISCFKPVKTTTVTCNVDGNVVDVTYDKVILASLEQVYFKPDFPGKEGPYWKYYKRLLKSSSPEAPLPFSNKQRIKYKVSSPTDARYYWSSRTAYRYSSYYSMKVNIEGAISSDGSRTSNNCAPAVFISK